jgi:hypothetical protein
VAAAEVNSGAWLFGAVENATQTPHETAASSGESITMGFFKRLLGTSKVQAGHDSRPPLSSDPQQGASILDEAEAFVLKLWNEQHSLVRQAVFWDERNEVSMVAFTNAASRDASLQELRESAKNRRPRRVFFFSESNATAPDGQQLDVIVIEVGDAQLGFYGQRIYSAEDAPQQLAEDTMPLDESPFAGLASVHARLNCVE